jgi:RNA polymerase sigma factor (sigma-70 family)
MNLEKDFEKNTGLVWHIINKHFRGVLEKHGFTEEDGYQVGCIGLMNAINRFEEDRGLKFATYAAPLIYGEIANSIRNTGHTIKVSRRSWSAFNKIRKRDTVPTINEIMEEFGIQELYAKEAIELLYMKIVSTEENINGSGEKATPLIEILVDDKDDEFNLSHERKIEFEERMSLLKDNERQVVELSLRGLRQREVASIMGCSQVQVSRLLKKGIARIEKEYEVAI